MDTKAGKAAEAKAEAKAVVGLRVTSDYSFYGDDGLERKWAGPLHQSDRGQIVTDPDEIEMLLARGAPVERIEIDPKTVAANTMTPAEQAAWLKAAKEMTRAQRESILNEHVRLGRTR